MILELRAVLATVRQRSWLRSPQHQILGALAILIVGAWVTIALMTSAGMVMGGDQSAPIASHRTTAAMQMPGMAESAGMGGMAGMAGMAGMPGMSATPTMRSAAATGQSRSAFSVSGGEMWALMIVAMMLPSVLPVAAYAGAQTLRWRRRRTMVELILGYTTVWLLAGALILLATAFLRGFDVALVLAACLAAAWQFTAPKRRALLDCHRPLPPRPYGAAAPCGAVTFGVRHGWACVRSCWTMMVVMGLVSAAQIWWMAAITALVVGEKLALRPRRASKRVGSLLGVAAAMVGVIALG